MACPAKVSIGIPTFNRSQSLCKAIEGVLGQTYGDFELVICDDASTDGTADVVARYKDPRIRYIRNPKNLGLYQNINRCIELSRGEYVAVYHDHDDYLPTIVEESVKVLDAHPNVGFVHTAIRSKNAHGEIAYTFAKDWPVVMAGRAFAEKIVHRWDSLICGAVAMVRRSLYDEVGYFDPLFGPGADIDMWVRLALLADMGYVKTPQAVMMMRQSGDAYGSFRWCDVIGHFRLIERNLERIYESSPYRYAWHRRRYEFARDLKLLELCCRLIAKFQIDKLQEARAVLKEEGSCWVGLSGGVLCRYPNLSGHLLHLPLIAYRAGWKLRINTEQRRAGQILAQDGSR